VVGEHIREVLAQAGSKVSEIHLDGLVGLDGLLIGVFKRFVDTRLAGGLVQGKGRLFLRQRTKVEAEVGKVER
jgi:hypothetical protein